MSGRFPDNFLAEIRTRVPISEVVAGYLPLKQSGNTLKGLCPFHNEKTPSFQVSDAKGFYYCFGCGAGGDLFKFLMMIERMSFPEAVAQLAERAGLELPRGERSAGSERRGRLLDVNALALGWFREQLAGRAGASARALLSRRGLRDETIERFELGFAPEGWDGLGKALAARGVKPAELLACGLVRERSGGNGCYDVFRARVIFPIRSLGGGVIGFGGRALGDEPPKYLNSPDTELYAKGEVLYGMPLARDAIRRSRRVLLVEGYMDLIALHEAGFEECVAVLGTSLTASHARLLKRHADQVVLAYDADEAGQRAIRRALGVLLPAGLQVRVLGLEAGLDPDDFVRARGSEALATQLETAPSFVDYLLSSGQASTDEAKLELAQEVVPFVAQLEDPLARRLHAGRIAERLGVEDAVVLQLLRRASAGAAAAALRDADQRPAAGSGTRRTRPTLAETNLAAALFSEEGWVGALAQGLPEDALEGLALGPVLQLARERRLQGLPLGVGAELEEQVSAEELGWVRQVLLETPVPTRQQAEAAVQALITRGLERRQRELQGQLKELETELREGRGDAASLLVRKLELAKELDRVRRT